MESPAFPLSNLKDDDLDFLLRLARRQREVLAFWRPLGAVVALALAERLLCATDEAAFKFPNGLTFEDAVLLRNEMTLLIARLGPGHSDGLLTFLQAIAVTAGAQAETRAVLN